MLKVKVRNYISMAEGDFNSLSMDDWERTMLEDAYKAVTKAKRWDFLRRKDVPGPKGFMFSEWPQMKDIDAFMEYGGHSGATYGMTMREMEFIAKNGWDAFATKYKNRQNSQKVSSNNSPLNNPLAFANALQNLQSVRSMIPNIDEQVDGIKKFADGEITYAEMRTLSG